MPVATIADLRFATAWALRGDAADATFVREAQRVLGVGVPVVPNTSATADAATVLWTGPRAWLFLDGAATSRGDYDAARRAIAAAGGALFDVSAAHAAWHIAGTGAARALSALCPLDLHPAVFPDGCCAYSVLGHVTASIHRRAAGDGYVVAVARSFGEDARTALATAVASVNAAAAAGDERG
jgi:sarcosine oxidase, subunit gamma